MNPRHSSTSHFRIVMNSFAKGFDVMNHNVSQAIQDTSMCLLVIQSKTGSGCGVSQDLLREIIRHLFSFPPAAYRESERCEHKKKSRNQEDHDGPLYLRQEGIRFCHKNGASNFRQKWI
jgi:hypothetical protein